MIAIDLGSNSLNCIEYDCAKKKWGKSFEAIVKTADNLVNTKQINKQAIIRVVSALMQAKKKLDFKNQKIIAITTAAMRLAKNADEVLGIIYEQTGIKFQVISGFDEAQYTIFAVKKRLDSLHVTPSSFVLVDIGGGSIEITFYNHDKIITKSFNLGIVTLTQMIKNFDEMEVLLEALTLDIKKYIDDYYMTCKKPEIFIQTAGTPTTIAAFLQGMSYANYDNSKINGYKLDVALYDEVMQKLLNMDIKTRSYYVGVGREDLIISGIIIVKKIFTLLDFTSSIVIDDSLREGLAFSYCEQLNNKT